MARHTRGSPCRLVTFAFGKGGLYRRGLVSKHEAGDLEFKIGMFRVTSFTSITGLLERAA
jgi:hypothetical protein